MTDLLQLLNPNDMTPAQRAQKYLELVRLKYQKACIDAATLDGFATFCKLMTTEPGEMDFEAKTTYRDMPFIRLLRSKYVQLATGALKKLAVSMPPQHGKSYTGFLFLAWYLGMFPDRRIVFVSYSQSFSEEQLGHIRAFMRTETYRKIFPHMTKFTKDSVGTIETEQGGFLQAKSHGSSITGKKLDLIWIDDLYTGTEFGTREELTISAWFRKNVITRIRRNTALAMIGTRWSENDMIGQMADPGHPNYKNKPGHARQVDSWGLINIPAILDTPQIVDTLNRWVYPHEKPYVLGQALDEQEHPLDSSDGFGGMTLMDKQNDLGITFYSVYQGRPTPDEGFNIKKEWIRYHEPFKIRKGQRVYMSFDLHGGGAGGSGHDASSFAVGVLDEDDNVLRVVKVYNERLPVESFAKRIVDLCEEYRPEIVFTEKGTIWNFVWAAVQAEMTRRGKWFVFEPKNPGAGGKTARAIPLQGLMASGRMTFERDAVWLGPTIEQLIKFPNATYDDIVDALAWMSIGVHKMLTSSVGEVSTKPQEDPTSGQILRESLQRARSDKRKSLRMSRVGTRCL